MPPIHQKILVRAAEIIEDRGWVQGNYSTPRKNSKGEEIPGPVCASRAITDAAKDLGATERERWDARYAVFEVTGRDSIATWNDQGKRTKEGVLEALRAAAHLPVTWVNHIK